MISPTAASCGCWTATRTPTRSRGPARRSPRLPSRSTRDRSTTPTRAGRRASPAPCTPPAAAAALGGGHAVTLVLATQRPTQKVMGHSAVRSQMNIRISFRVEEQRDVDLVLGQGKLKAGWHAHKLNAPGKFLLWSPEHDTPRRARAYLLTDADATGTAARYTPAQPPLDPISRPPLAAGPPSA